MSASEENVQRVKTFFETLSTGDLEKVRPLLHVDASWLPMVTGIPGEGIKKGRDFIIDEFLEPVRGMFEPGDPKVHIDNIISQGDTVVCETRGTGKLKNGKDYNNVYCWVIELKDGKIFAIREYMDSYHVSTLV